MKNIKTLVIKHFFYEAIQNNGILVYNNIIIDIDDWIIRLTDNYYIVLDNKLKEELFKE